MTATAEAPVQNVPMSLQRGEHYAVKILDWIKDYVHRAEVAGSIRRQCFTVNDVDIVCIPKREEIKDLTGAVVETRCPLLFFLMKYVEENKARGATFINGGGKTESPNQFLVKLPGCQLDLWLCDEENWITRFICRTGSRQFNIRMCQRAQTLQMRWNPYVGLMNHRNEVVPLKTEQDFFDALKTRYLTPKERSFS